MFQIEVEVIEINDVFITLTCRLSELSQALFNNNEIVELIGENGIYHPLRDDYIVEPPNISMGHTKKIEIHIKNNELIKSIGKISYINI